MLRKLATCPASSQLNNATSIRVPLSAPLCSHPGRRNFSGQPKAAQKASSQSATMSCEDCAKPAEAVKGNFWAGEPSGKEVKLNGVDTYVAQPSSPTGKAVILIPDVFGAAPVRLDSLWLPSTSADSSFRRLCLHSTATSSTSSSPPSQRVRTCAASAAHQPWTANDMPRSPCRCAVDTFRGSRHICVARLACRPCCGVWAG